MDTVILTLKYFLIFCSYFTDTNTIFPSFPDKCFLAMVEQALRLIFWAMSTVTQDSRNSFYFLIEVTVSRSHGLRPDLSRCAKEEEYLLALSCLLKKERRRVHD